MLGLNQFSRLRFRISELFLIVITSHLGICCVVKYIRTPSYDYYYYLSVLLPFACCPLLMLCLFRLCDIVSSILSWKRCGYRIIMRFSDTQMHNIYDCFSLLLSINQDDNKNDSDDEGNKYWNFISILFLCIRMANGSKLQSQSVNK